MGEVYIFFVVGGTRVFFTKIFLVNTPKSSVFFCFKSAIYE